MSSITVIYQIPEIKYGYRLSDESELSVFGQFSDIGKGIGDHYRSYIQVIVDPCKCVGIEVFLIQEEKQLTAVSGLLGPFFQVSFPVIVIIEKLDINTELTGIIHK